MPEQVIPNLQNGVTYHWRQTAFNTKGFANTELTGALASCTPKAFVKYGVRIDETNSNPETAVVYTDDCAGFTPSRGNNGNFQTGSWDDNADPIFSRILPCLLKDGKVAGYLNKQNYAQFADGSAADITSGNAGDVMVEFPKLAYSIKRVGNYLHVKVTDDPNPANGPDEDWCFYAFTRQTEGDRDKLYVGAYLGYVNGGKLRSLSGKQPTANQTIGTFRTQAQANGNGYDQMAFYPLTLLQCLYLVRFKSLDSQTALGYGFQGNGSNTSATGSTNAQSMYYGGAGGTIHMKLLGIEDFWGNLGWFIDGFIHTASSQILTAFKNFNSTGNGYSSQGSSGLSNFINGLLKKVQGTSGKGFIPLQNGGSGSTYYADYMALGPGADCMPECGAANGGSTNSGIFYLNVVMTNSYANSISGSRLMYL